MAASVVPRLMIAIPAAAAVPNVESVSDDAEALADLRRGDHSALDVLYQRHAGRLLQLARRLTGSRADAEDVVHDVFVELPRRVMTLSADSDLGAWLRTVVINRCIDRNRVAARRRALEPHIVAASAPAEREADAVAAERIEDAIRRTPIETCERGRGFVADSQGVARVSFGFGAAQAAKDTAVMSRTSALSVAALLAVGAELESVR